MDESYRDIFHRYLADELSSTDLISARSAIDKQLSDENILTQLEGIEEFNSEQFDEWSKRIYQDQETELGELSSLWFAQSKEALCYFIMQFAPLELTGSGWWRSSSTTGTFSKSKAALFEVLYDLIGRGKITEHFSNNYLDLLKSLGVHLPPVQTQAFSKYEDICDEAYILPATLLRLSLYSKTFMPVIMGMVLYQEVVRVPVYLAVAEALERYGMPSFFFRKRAYSRTPYSSGRGLNAIQAIKELMQECGRSLDVWRKIRTGVILAQKLALPITSQAWDRHRSQEPREKFRKLLEIKAPIASTAHGKTTLSNKDINHHFSDSRQFLNALESSHWVVAGNPEKSPFISYLLAFEGPMYQVFNEEEVNIIRLWILSLKDTPFTQMYRLLIDKKETIRRTDSMHNVFLDAKEGHQSSVAELVKQPLELMQAFKQSDWCEPENPRIVLECQENGLLRSLMSYSDVATIKKWINEGALLE